MPPPLTMHTPSLLLRPCSSARRHADGRQVMAFNFDCGGTLKVCTTTGRVAVRWMLAGPQPEGAAPVPDFEPEAAPTPSPSPSPSPPAAPVAVANKVLVITNPAAATNW